jgi:hypothetical protein
MILQLFVGRWPLIQFLNLFTQSVGLLRRGISPSQGRYLHTQNNTNTDIHASSVIRNHDPSVRAGEDSSCLRPRGHCDRQLSISHYEIWLRKTVLVPNTPASLQTTSAAEAGTSLENTWHWKASDIPGRKSTADVFRNGMTAFKIKGYLRKEQRITGIRG